MSESNAPPLTALCDSRPQRPRVRRQPRRSAGHPRGRRTERDTNAKPGSLRVGPAGSSQSRSALRMPRCRPGPILRPMEDPPSAQVSNEADAAVRPAGAAGTRRAVPWTKGGCRGEPAGLSASIRAAHPKSSLFSQFHAQLTHDLSGMKGRRAILPVRPAKSQSEATDAISRPEPGIRRASARPARLRPFRPVPSANAAARAGRQGSVAVILFSLGKRFGSSAFLRRAAVASAILSATLIVSVVWQEMVYTIPVLAVLLFLAAGTNAQAGPTRRNLDQDSTDAVSDG